MLCQVPHKTLSYIAILSSILLQYNYENNTGNQGSWNEIQINKNTYKT